jgi:hypothetical protein
MAWAESSYLCKWQPHSAVKVQTKIQSSIAVNLIPRDAHRILWKEIIRHWQAGKVESNGSNMQHERQTNETDIAQVNTDQTSCFHCSHVEFASVRVSPALMLDPTRDGPRRIQNGCGGWRCIMHAIQLALTQNEDRYAPPFKILFGQHSPMENFVHTITSKREQLIDHDERQRSSQPPPWRGS